MTVAHLGIQQPPTVFLGIGYGVTNAQEHRRRAVECRGEPAVIAEGVH